MIGRYLQEGCSRHRDRIALVQGKECVTYGDIGLLVNGLVETFGEFSGKRVGVCISSPLPFVGAAAVLDLLGSHAFLVGRRNQEELGRLNDTFRWHGILREEDVLARFDAGKKYRHHAYERAGLVTILTSGTTGKAKAVNHSWTTLASPVRKDERYIGTRWLLTYPLTRYAGTQVFLQAFVNWATLVIPASLDPGEITHTLLEARVTHASGTPTFWRQLLLFTSREDLRACQLEQLTIGGEPVTQELLDNLRLVFPRTRIVHVYASTELGRMFSVTDGREGFPAKFLREQPEEGIELRVVDDELMARSRHAMISYDSRVPLRDKDGGWQATGDLVEVRDDRVIFKGRSTDIINVGGSKVYPTHVEAALRSVSGVVDIRVYAKESSVVGQLVAADIVLAPGVEEEAASSELRRVAGIKLQPHEIPRILRVVPKTVRNEAFKVVRKDAQE